MTAKDSRIADLDARRRGGLGPLLWLGEVRPVLAKAHLVRDLLSTGSAAVVFGDAGSGKTFFVLDLALHIAAGQPWRGRRVQAGLVLYVAAEGGVGIRNRLAAYCLHAPWAKGAPFAVLPQAVDMLDPAADTDRLVRLVQVAEGEAGTNAALIVLDTLARVIPGGNENAADDMSAFIANVDRLRAATGAAVLMVHHAGKDATKGARGHSSLRAAVDTEIQVEGQSGTRTATVSKQRDLPVGDRFAFDLVSVEIGTDEENGLPVTSCVLAVAEPPAAARREPTGKHQGPLLNALREHDRSRPDCGGRITAAEIASMCRALGIDRRRRAELIGSLVTAGHLLAGDGGYMLIRENR